MRGLIKRIFLFLFAVGALQACSNKNVENNIKSLERRVAALEGKSGISPASATNSTSEENEGDPTKFPVMTFEQTEHDFGTIKEGDIVDYTYKFKNTGSFPLIINKATATCGCTVPEWPKNPVPAGGEGVIRVKFNSENKHNLQTKYVSINANTKPEVTKLKLTGNVIAKDDSNS